MLNVLVESIGMTGNNCGGRSVCKGMMRYVAIVLLSGAVFAQEQKAPERVVRKNVITSERNPKIRIELPKEARHVGVERWDLYGVADCELHVWVETGKDKVVNRVYWVQFEGFLPSKPESRYRYPFTRTAEIGGLTFDVRPRFGANHERPKPDSDAGHVWKMVEAAGYQWPQDEMSVRLVYLPDEQKRTELMIIYVENLKPTGLTAADLMPGGKGVEQWTELQKGLIEQAARRVKVSFPTAR